jgi:hypothetical protein
MQVEICRKFTQAEGGWSARRRNSRPKCALLRDVFCLVSRIPSVESARCAEEAMLRRAGREATAQAARKGPRAESTRSTGEPPDRSLILNQRFKIAPVTQAQ